MPDSGDLHSSVVAEKSLRFLILYALDKSLVFVARFDQKAYMPLACILTAHGNYLDFYKELAAHSQSHEMSVESRDIGNFMIFWT